jgi:DNA replication protein DnaC
VLRLELSPLVIRTHDESRRCCSRIDVLVIDDWVMAPLSEPERRDTLADGILDRLVHNAHRIEMRGDSMRNNRGKVNA